MTLHSPLSQLDQLRSLSIVVSDTGDIDEVRRLKPTDCTTNPTLLLKAAQNPAYAGLVREAADWARAATPQGGDEVQAACDRLLILFGRELAALVPGRVSIEVDADLAHDAAATVAKARALLAQFAAAGIGRERLLIKIAATLEGLCAARQLQAEGTDCNLTLLFSQVQAQAAAEAGAFLISPFVGRVLDWHLAQGEGPFAPETDPGVALVRAIYQTYKASGVTTVVMGASFRNLGEIQALAGCDRLTLSPALIDQLAAERAPLKRALSPPQATSAARPPALDEAEFRRLMALDCMASEKLAEGVAAFALDLQRLRAFIGGVIAC